MSEGSHDVKKEVARYFLVFGALLILSALTVGVSYIHFGVALAVTIALVIATVKGSLVASYFMHLSHEKKLIYVVLVFTVFFFISMMALILSAYHDKLVGTEDLNKLHRPAGAVQQKHDQHAGGHP